MKKSLTLRKCYDDAVMDDHSRLPGGRFKNTRWSLVVRAGAENDPDSHQALESLCKIYWPPVYAYVRRRGYDCDNALDLTQGFFAQFLEKKSLRAADRTRGKFRSFLLTSVKNYLANQWDKEHSKGRGEGKPHFPLDDGNDRIEPVDIMTPEKNFERVWALTLLKRVLTRLAKSERYFEQLEPCLMGENRDAPYKSIAQDLGVTEGALKTRIHRMRKRYVELLRDEVRQTLDDAGNVEDEIRYLLTIL